MRHEAIRDFVQILIIAEPKKKPVVPSFVQLCTRMDKRVLESLQRCQGPSSILHIVLVCGAGLPCGRRNPI